MRRMARPVSIDDLIACEATSVETEPIRSFAGFRKAAVGKS
jgi:hypothetical protein